MRDPDNRVLGGVAGGIAAYMGWDVTAVRLAMIILLFIPYAPIIILYLILWLGMPLARSRQADDARTKRHPRKHRQNSYGWLREGQQ